MKKFIKKFSLFIFPITIIIAPVLYLCYYSGEFNLNLNKINKLDSYYIGFRYTTESKYGKIKIWNLENNKPYKILVLGSSRVLQFRDSLFRSSFYNAGYTIGEIQDFEGFIRSIPANKYPKLLIIGLDQWMFNKNWSKANLSTQLRKYNSNIAKENVYEGVKPVFVDLINGDLLLKEFANENKIGIDAKNEIKGFRKDGSLYYMKQTKGLLNFDTTVIDYKFWDTKDRINKGNRRFEHGNYVNKDAINILKRLLNFCDSNSIHVIGFLPPFAPEIISEMKICTQMNYVFNIYHEIKHQTCRMANFELYDYTSWGSNSWFLDGFHGSEYCYSKICSDMANKSVILNNHVDTSYLQQSIFNAPNRLKVFNN